ncbi:GNAT family N-acetyltransferase [Palleronia sp.]|uniref:GNAT family N-acetyltransferase n=1 Tax=Palleronia sp. TaxID=1940284 RepID=UPI0035C7AC67
MVTIRRGEARDVAAVQAIATRAFGGHVAAIGRRPAPMEADYAVLVALGEVLVVGSPRIEGLAVRRFDGGRVLVEIVAVEPDAAGQGLGRALVARCEDEGRQRGCTVAALYTNAKMEANLRIWPRLGYVEVARRVEDGFDRVFYEKRLE